MDPTDRPLIQTGILDHKYGTAHKCVLIYLSTMLPGTPVRYCTRTSIESKNHLRLHIDFEVL